MTKRLYDSELQRLEQGLDTVCLRPIKQILSHFLNEVIVKRHNESGDQESLTALNLMCYNTSVVVSLDLALKGNVFLICLMCLTINVSIQFNSQELCIWLPSVQRFLPQV